MIIVKIVFKEIFELVHLVILLNDIHVKASTSML